MKKATVMILIILLLNGTTISYADSPFSDLQSSNWAYDAVEASVNTEMVKGYPDGTFKPNNTVTYGEFIKMVYIAGTNGKDPGNSESGHWALNYYHAAKKLGYFTEADIKESQLNVGIPRSDMGLIIGSMIAEKIDYDRSKEEGGEFRFTVGDKEISYDDAVKMADDLLTDIDSTTNHKDQIIMAYLNGVLTGYSNNTFRPNNTLTRAEAATVFYRILDTSKKIIPEFLKDQITDEKIAEMLQKESETDGLTNAEFLGVDSVKKLKEELPITYYSYIATEKNSIGEAIYNTDEIANPVFVAKYYKIVSPNEIGITSIQKTVDKFNSEQFEVLPGNKSTNAVLIKDNKVVCELTRCSGDETTPLLFFPGTDKYYNGNYKNNVLMDFDYIGFWTYPSDTIFLVKKPW